MHKSIYTAAFLILMPLSAYALESDIFSDNLASDNLQLDAQSGDLNQAPSPELVPQEELIPTEEEDLNSEELSALPDTDQPIPQARKVGQICLPGPDADQSSMAWRLRWPQENKAACKSHGGRAFCTIFVRGDETDTRTRLRCSDFTQ